MNTAALRPKVYSYLRFSSPEQAKGDSLRRQTAAAQAWAAEHGMVFDEELRDEGISGWRGTNLKADASLGAFVKAVHTGAVAPGSVLVIESLDRMSRDDVLVASTMLNQLLLAGLRVVKVVRLLCVALQLAESARVVMCSSKATPGAVENPIDMGAVPPLLRYWVAPPSRDVARLRFRDELVEPMERTLEVGRDVVVSDCLHSARQHAHGGIKRGRHQARKRAEIEVAFGH